MGQTCKREHGSKRAAFAALAATGLLAALLALAGLAAPAPAYAAGLQGKGTADDPVLIYNTDDLIAWCRDMLNPLPDEDEYNQHARLMADLTEGHGGVVTDDVIGKMSHNNLKVAEFDGNGHLMELQITGKNGGALFVTGGKPSDSGGPTVIKNLNIIGQVQNANQHGGGTSRAATLFEAVGQDEKGARHDRWLEIRDCTNQASVAGDDAAGGFIGKYYDHGEGSLVIEGCANFGDISADGGAGDNSGFAGGIVGYIKTTSPSVPCTLQRCSNNGAITALNTRGACSAGGVVGYMYVEESQGYDLGYCFNQGAVTVSGSTSHAGGVVGLLDGPNVALLATTACYSTGQIEAAAAANSGGIFGGLNVSSTLSKCFTLTGSVQDESHASSDLNGTFRYRYEFMTDVASDMDYDVYAGGSHHTCLKYPEYDFPMLRGVATGKKITLTWVMPLNGESTQSECYWNTVPDSMPTMEAPEGYRFVYWTTEAPTAGTWDTPPAEYKADENDIYDRIYGGDDHVFYAYCVPNSYTVEFDLNAPNDQKQCSMKPAAPATKTVMEGEPLGALPVCTNNQTIENGGRAFLGWVTAYDDATNTESFWVDENTVLDPPSNRKLTLYAQWGTPRLSPFVITSQPEDCVVSAAADAPREAREATFSFATNYKTSNYDYFDAMLQKKVAGTWVDVKYAGRNKTSCTIDVDYPDQAALEYRFRIEYRDSDYEGFIATTSANIVLDIPVTTARITSINPLDDTAADKVLGTHSYDINVELSDIVELMGAYKYRYAHTAWIEGGPDNIVTDKGYYEDFPFTMENQTLREGQTYTLCVAHAINDVNALLYKGESEPYRVEFTVPYSDSVVTDITSAQVTKDPVVKDGNPVDFNADYSVPLEGTFNVVADAQWAQPVTRGVTAQWQYKPSGGSWTDVPDEYYAKEGGGMTWNGDKTAARMHASLNAKAALNGARFRVRLSTPPATADAASGASAKDLVVNVPTPVLGEPKVTNDTHLSLSWAWEDGAGNKVANDGYYVKVESEYGSGGGYSRTDHVYANTYDATLNPQVDYTVKVWASVDGLQGPSSETTFKTTGPMELTWRYDYLTYYLAEGKNDYLSVQHSWAKYNDGKHAARYEWQLSKDASDPATFDTFAVTEANEAKFPASFKSDKQPWDVEEAQWVRVSASVWELDDQGEPAREVEGTRAYATPVPIVHETTAPQNVSARDVGSHSATICWDAPDKGLVREYQVEVGGQKRIVEAKEGQTSYAVTVDGLESSSSSQVKVSTFDPRKGTDYSGVIASTYSSVITLPSPEAGTWTAAASPDMVNLTDTVTLSASYEANSGSFESAEVQWYSWREGDEVWEPVEGSEMTFNGADQTHTATFDYRVTSDDYGRQWKLGVKAGTPDEHVTGSSNAVTMALTLSAPTKVTLGESTTTSIPVTWDAVEGVEGDDSGYLVQRELIRDNYIVGIHTYRLNASDLDVDGDGNLHYVMENLKPDTEYRVAVAAFAGSVRSDYKYQYTNGKTKPVEVRPPVFVEVPKSKKPDAFNDATFDAKVAVEPDQGALEYRWQRKGPGEQEFTDVVLGDKYQVSAYDYSDGLGITLAVKNVEASDVGTAFRCVAAHVVGDQRAETISGAAYLYVDVQDPQSVQATAQGSTTAEVTWEPAGLVRRFTVDYQREGAGDASWQQSVVTLDSDATSGSCLLEGLVPNTKYLVKVTAAPQAGFSSKAVETSFTTKPASELATATVSATPDDKVVDPGTQVTYKVETNVDGKPGEALSYRWQYNSFGEGWYDVDGAPNANELAVTAPDAGTAMGYRCIVTSSKDGGDETSVTSSAALLLTRVDVEPPVRLAAETDTTSAHLSWEGNDVRPAAYEVQYAEGPTPPEDGSDAWITVENVGEGTSCDVEGLAPNTVYSWRVRAVVRDELRSDWAMGQAFTTLAETSALATVTVTPRWGACEVNDAAGVDYAVTTNLDNIQGEEKLSYQWQQSETGDVWKSLDGQAKRSFTATGASVVPHRSLYRCVVTASKGGETLKTLASEPVSFMTVPKAPTGLKADGITATAANLAWTSSLYDGDGLSYRVFWRPVGTEDWQSDTSQREPAYALSGLMPATTYEWYVQVMNGNAPSATHSATSTFVTQSLRPLLTRVVVDPVDQTLDYDGQAAFTAYTNVDAIAETTEMTYVWQKRAIDSDPQDEQAWSTIGGNTRTMTLDANVDGYVRCKVTYQPKGLVVEPLTGAAVLSDEARVRFMPTLPAGLAASNTTQTTATLAWTASQGQELSGYEVEYRAVGTEEWSTLTSGAAEASVEAKDLTPGTVYEWHVRALAYADSDELSTDWVDGVPFATQPVDIVLSKVEVAPSATSVMAGAKETVTLTATTDADGVEEETLTYQWQSKTGPSDWADVKGAAANTLEVSTQDMTAGAYSYRCVVTATRDHAGEPKKVESGEAVVTVMPATPTDLSVSDIKRLFPDDPNHTNVAATFHFAWGGTFVQQSEVQFEVSYQKIAGIGADEEWKSETFPYDASMAYTTQSLIDEDLTYQWRVRAVQNGVASSWSEVKTFTTAIKKHEDLNLVEVKPSDKLLSATDSATFTVTTNVDKESKDTLAYAWQWCELTKDPRKTTGDYAAVWTTIDGENSDTLTISPDEQEPTNNQANRYVRCQVTQTVGGESKTLPSNLARVRVEPVAPTNPEAKIGARYYESGNYSLSWDCDDARSTNLRGSAIQYELNYRAVGSSEWKKSPSSPSTSKSASLHISSLEPGVTYEWRVRAVLKENMSMPYFNGGPSSEWVDGPLFTVPKIDATPTASAAVVGNGRAIAFTATPDAFVQGMEELSYQWQRKLASGSYGWGDVPDATSATLTVKANDATAAGTATYRCLIKAKWDKVSDGKWCTMASNDVKLTLAPAAPANLTASDIGSTAATLAWDWTSGSLAADRFDVFYRESGTEKWYSAEVNGDAKTFALEGLESQTAYEWYVQAVQEDGLMWEEVKKDVKSLPSSRGVFATSSEIPPLTLEAVAVKPADQTLDPTDQATLTASTNLDGVVVKDALAYTWERRALDSDPSDENAWELIEGKDTREVRLDAGTSGYVRCTVEYVPVSGDAQTQTSDGVRVVVRTQLDAPTDLSASADGSSKAALSWQYNGGLPEGGTFAVSYRVDGTSEWTVVGGIKESPYTLSGLASNTTYEWRVCAVSVDGFASEWANGEKFTTSALNSTLESAAAAPPSAEAVAGESALVADFFVKDIVGGQGEALAYQWQSKVGATWVDLPGENGERTHLSVAAWEAGEYTLRCAVTATPAGGTPKTVYSNEVALTLSPMAPSGLDAREVTTDAAALAWTWAGPGTADSVEFNVRYREEGTSDTDWVEVPAGQIDAANMTCTVDGLVPGMSYEWQVQTEQGGQTSGWSESSGFVTLSGGSLKIARIWPPDVTVAADKQASFAAFTNRGDADDVSYEWQYRALGSLEDAWETIPNATGRILKLGANTSGYVRCVARQAAPAAEMAEVAEVVETPEMSAAPEANETLGANEVPEVIETFAATEPAVVYSNQARVRVEPHAPSGLAVSEVGFRDAALSWAASDAPDGTYTVAYRVAGTDEWTEVADLSTPAYALEGLVPGTRYEWRVQSVAIVGGDPLASEWAHGDSFTTQALKTYRVTAGADGTWKPGQPGLSFTIDAPRDEFQSVTVDGVKLVLGEDYTLADDGMTVTLSPDYLAKLAVGKHALVATFANGTASTSFAVASVDPGPKPNPNPPTPTPTPVNGDGNGGKVLAPTGDPLAPVSIVAAALAAACVALVARRKMS